MRNATALLVLAGLLTASSSASAAILSYGCRGDLGGQHFVFNRDGLYVTDPKTVPGKAKKFTKDTVSDEISTLKDAKAGVIEFSSNDAGDLDETPFEFTRIDDNKKQEKIVFTHVSSKRTSHKHRMICGRDEDTDLYRKVFAFKRGEEPPRDITMQCFFYQLSTRGGRKGCGGD